MELYGKDLIHKLINVEDNNACMRMPMKDESCEIRQGVEMLSRILVIGCGNILLRDEGIGVHVVNHLSKMLLPQDVEIIDGGTASFVLLQQIRNAAKVIIVDAVLGNGDPGTMYRIKMEDLDWHGYGAPSLHQCSVMEVLGLACMIEQNPEIVIFGIEPESMEYGLDLTETVAGRMTKIIEMIWGEVGSIQN
jgi:hydrogenase maturation protease